MVLLLRICSTGDLGIKKGELMFPSFISKFNFLILLYMLSNFVILQMEAVKGHIYKGWEWGVWELAPSPCSVTRALCYKQKSGRIFRRNLRNLKIQCYKALKMSRPKKSLSPEEIFIHPML